jgi:hypothetical protein
MVAPYMNIKLMRNATMLITDGYLPQQIVDLEQNFLRTYVMGGKTEDSLFEAMTSTLEMLRRIHIEAGEDVEVPILWKRRQPCDLVISHTHHENRVVAGLL